MPLPISGDNTLELEIWYCDPDRIRIEGISNAPVSGCGFIMFQVTNDMQVNQCPACDEVYPFEQQPQSALIKVVV